MHPSSDGLSPDHETEHGDVRSVQEGLMVSGQVCLVGGGLDHARPRRGGLAGVRARWRRPRQADIGRRRHRLVAMGSVSGSSRQRSKPEERVLPPPSSRYPRPLPPCRGHTERCRPRP